MFTRRWVVDLVLDLVAYTEDRDLAPLRLVEPACGAGSFLAVVAARVGQSCRKHDRNLLDAQDAVRAFDLLPHNVAVARSQVESVLIADGWGRAAAAQISRAWIRQADYLLDEECAEPADVIVGNPPYVRLENVADVRTAQYRQAWATMTGRADLYVGFFEAALASLRAEGVLGFICADRWMRNQYGRELRRLVADEHAVDVIVSMHDVDAFDSQVSAYPAITVLRKGAQGRVVAAQTDRTFTEEGARQLYAWIRNGEDGNVNGRGFTATRLPHWFSGGDLWPSASPERLRILENLTDRFVALGDRASGVRVGIGVATGADKVFITKDDFLVEADRLLPLAMVRDVRSGVLRWSGCYLVNPWDNEGKLVDLSGYPQLAAYLATHETTLRDRHVGRRQPNNWYRTIDKIDSELTARAKLLIPDMNLRSEPVLDPGGCYPHHNLYFISSDVWDLQVLGGLLISKVAEAFVDAYAVKMRGGTLRFQAQYLRRIPLPDHACIAPQDKQALTKAFERRDVIAATRAALRVYGIDHLPS